MRGLNLLAAALLSLCLLAPVRADLPPLPTVAEKVDLQRYDGNWYVHGSIPLKIPFFSDAEAYNYAESYEILDNGKIRMTCSFQVGGFDGETRSFSFNGKVADEETFAEWQVQFVWPIKASYKIIYLDENYETTVVASPNRKFAWIMSRQPAMDDSKYDEMIELLDSAGYEIEKMRRIPHSWPT